MELHRGPHGLGLALVDGTVRPRRGPGAAAQSRRIIKHVTVLELAVNLFLFHGGAENAAEDERHLREVGGPRLSRRSVSEAENRRPHPGRQRRQPGGDGVQRVSIGAHRRTPSPRGCVFTDFCVCLSGRELIRSSGDSLRLLVAKIDSKTSRKGSMTTKC